MPPHVPIECPQHPTYDTLKVIRAALEEDSGGLGDVTTEATIPPSTQAVATFSAKAEGVLAGLGVADMVLQEVDPSVKAEWRVRDGDKVSAGQVLGVLRGSARSILVAERIMLNFMQVLETRKTAPGLRLLDKWAVLIGGGANHRMGLYDMMMIKDNHIAAAGGIKAAVQRAEEYISSRGLSDKMTIEVEARTMHEVDEVLEVLQELSSKAEEPPSASHGEDAAAAAANGAAGGAGSLLRGHHVRRVMLDNMAKRDALKEGGVDVTMLAEAVARIGGAVETEASGNVTLSSVRAIAATGVTYVSVGALTHSVTALDISLNIETQ